MGKHSRCMHLPVLALDAASVDYMELPVLSGGLAPDQKVLVKRLTKWNHSIKIFLNFQTLKGNYQ